MGSTVVEVEDVLKRYNPNFRALGFTVDLERVEDGRASLSVDLPPFHVGVCSGGGCDLPLPGLLMALERELRAIPGIRELRWTAASSAM